MLPPPPEFADTAPPPQPQPQQLPDFVREPPPPPPPPSESLPPPGPPPPEPHDRPEPAPRRPSDPGNNKTKAAAVRLEAVIVGLKAEAGQQPVLPSGDAAAAVWRAGQALADAAKAVLVALLRRRQQAVTVGTVAEVPGASVSVSGSVSVAGSSGTISQRRSMLTAAADLGDAVRDACGCRATGGDGGGEAAETGAGGDLPATATRAAKMLLCAASVGEHTLSMARATKSRSSAVDRDPTRLVVTRCNELSRALKLLIAALDSVHREQTRAANT